MLYTGGLYTGGSELGHLLVCVRLLLLLLQTPLLLLQICELRAGARETGLQLHAHYAVSARG